MTTTDQHDIVQIAKRIRKALKSQFPGQKFSVRTDRFSGGSSCDIRWIDGPTQDAVSAVVDQVKASDPHEAHHHWHEDYWSGSHYYNLSREYSVAALESAANGISQNHFDFADTRYDVVASYRKGEGSLRTDSFRFSDQVYRDLRQTSFEGA